MAAEFHLAEDALALHLLLQHLEGLIDIVVPDKNLHAAFLFDRAIDGSDGQRRPGHWRAEMYNSDAFGTRGTNQRRYLNLSSTMAFGVCHCVSWSFRSVISLQLRRGISQLEMDHELRPQLMRARHSKAHLRPGPAAYAYAV